MFNGYDGESNIVFDDFYGEVRYSDLLDIMDGYQQMVNVKYGHRFAQWTTVYFTSNLPPEDWYRSQFPEGISPALSRRITTVIKLNEKSSTDIVNDSCSTTDSECGVGSRPVPPPLLSVMEVAGNTTRTSVTDALLPPQNNVIDVDITKLLQSRNDIPFLGLPQLPELPQIPVMRVNNLAQSQMIVREEIWKDNILDPDIAWLLDGI